MEFKAEFTQTRLAKLVVHDVKSRLFFRNEENLLSESQKFGDDVRNRLTFPRAGGPLEDETNPRARLFNRFKLTGIGVDDVLQFDQRVV